MTLRLVAGALVAALSCLGCDEPGPSSTDELCSNDLDDDHDGFIDCRDVDCRDDPACREDCGNGLDDDADGRVDCDDPDCGPEQGCVEVCWNGVDDDGDGRVDCDDPDCEGDAGCGEVCDDGLDDDDDGRVDCFDSECEGAAGCGEVCDDGLDDDGDGLADCLDLECDPDPACAELCNGLDDDGDGRVDEAVSDEDAGEPCYGGPEEAAGVGACSLGRWTCFDGALACMGWGAPLDAELCNGLDDDCDGSVPRSESSCGTSGGPTDTLTFDVVAGLRDVDVQLDLGATASMVDEVAALGSGLAGVVEAVRALLPTAAFGLSTFVDFPVSPFGEAGDEPFALRQRVTTSSADALAALGRVVARGGGDLPGSGIEALHRLATGAGTSWPGLVSATEICDGRVDHDGDGLAGCRDPDCAGDPSCAGWLVEACDGETDDDLDGLVDCDDPDCGGDSLCGGAALCPSGAPSGPGLRAVTVTEIEDLGDVDGYLLDLPAGSVLVAEILAARAGSGLDAHLRVRAVPSGSELVRSSAFCGEDPRVAYGPVGGDETVVLEVLSDAASTGFYALHVTIDGAELVAAALPCAGVEAGGSPFGGTGYQPDRAVPLAPASSLYPRSLPRCEADCEVLLDDPLATEWVRSFCDGPPSAATCGDGIPDVDEQCDDGNAASGDGCDWACRLESSSTCGDGARDPAEECDDGNTASGDGCTAACLVEPGCGNGLTEPGEECDDGNGTSGDGCDATCSVERVCGDGVRIPSEACDDGGTEDGDGCDGSCALEPACGNAAVEEGEGCDDGGTEDGDGCDGSCALEQIALPAFDPLEGYDPGRGQGLLGGAGFRPGALPIVVHLSDAPSHAGTDYDGSSIDAHGEAETFDALEALSARVVGLWSSSEPVGADPEDLLGPIGMAAASGAAVPACAYDGSEARAAGLCGEGECCTGPGGAGRPPLDEGPGCPLAFEVGEDGAGLDGSILAAIEALVRQAPLDIALALGDEPGDRADGLCFVESVEVVEAAAASEACGPTPAVVDTDDDGDPDRVESASPGTRVRLRVSIQNVDRRDVDGDGDRSERCASSGTYGVHVDLVAGGGVLVGSQLVEVVVP